MIVYGGIVECIGMLKICGFVSRRVAKSYGVGLSDPKNMGGEKLSFFGAASAALMNGRRTWKIGLFRDCGVVPGAWNISVFVCRER